jgi:cell division protein ZapA (FtsZ GTPase activity inhibitor)
VEQESKHISVIIGGRSYNLQVESGEEKTVRDATELIKDKVAQIESRYPHKDKQDVLAMTLLTLHVDAMKNRVRNSLDQEVLTDRLHNLELMADALVSP